MGVPKSRITPSRRGQRRTFYRVPMPCIASCRNCGKAKIPHFICMKCGYYRGKQVIEINNNPSEKVD